MKVFTLDVATHEEFGNVGLRWKRWMDPFSGMGTAHDMLEHFPRDKGSTEEELMALGASFFVRDFGGYHAQKGSRNSNPGYHMGPDIADQQGYKSDRGEGMALRDPGRTTACEEIDEFIAEALKEARKESYERNDGKIPMYLHKSEEKKIYGWMRKGYRKAVRRYKGMKSWHVCHVFMLIEEAVDKFLKHCEDYGQKVKIYVDVDRSLVRLDELMEEY